MTRTFILGLGAQKAGTTWLHSVLEALPGANFGALKEYHVFDARYVPEHHEFRVGRRKALFSWLYTLRGNPHGSVLRLRSKLQADPSAYFEYFDGLLVGDTCLTGDITPAYASLPSDVLRQIREGFAQRDVKVKAVFLMRDPVERSWSAIRMRRRNRKERGAEVGPSEESELRDYFSSQAAILRASYHQTVGRIREVFEPEDIYLGLYETLFSAASIADLSAFLGHEIRAPDFDRHVNVSPKEAPISQELAIAIAQQYRAEYDFARHEFGHDLIDRLWRSGALLQRDS